MAVFLVEGFEHGSVNTTAYNTASQRIPLWNAYNTAASSTIAGSTTTPGSWSALSFDVNDASSAANPSLVLSTNPIAAQQTVSGSFRFRFVSALPSTNLEMFVIGTVAGSGPRLVFNTTDDKLYAAFDDNLDGTEEVAVSGVLVADTWYQVDFLWRADGDPNTFKARVDGANENTASLEQSITTSQNIRIGGTTTTVTQQGRWLIDDLVLDDTVAAYPLGPMKVYGLAPSSNGTHNTSGSFVQVGGTGGSWWTSIDSWGSGGGTFNNAEYIEQNVNGAGAYIEVGFESLPSLGADTVFGAGIAFLIWSSTTGANGAIAWMADSGGSVLTTLFTGDCSDTSERYQRWGAVAAPGGGWSESQANGLKYRMGGASAIPGNPRFSVAILQVAVKEGVAATVLPPKGRQLPLPVIDAVNRSRVY